MKNPKVDKDTISAFERVTKNIHNYREGLDHELEDRTKLMIKTLAAGYTLNEVGKLAGFSGQHVNRLVRAEQARQAREAAKASGQVIDVPAPVVLAPAPLRLVSSEHTPEALEAPEHTPKATVPVKPMKFEDDPHGVATSREEMERNAEYGRQALAARTAREINQAARNGVRMPKIKNEIYTD